MKPLVLPRADGTLSPYVPTPIAASPATRTAAFPSTSAPITSRIGYAAVHVVCDPLADNDPTLDVAVDWDATLAYRRYVWSLGLAVAEAMDTAQRGMGLPWASARELIKRSVAASKTVPGAVIASGAGTDHL